MMATGSPGFALTGQPLNVKKKDGEPSLMSCGWTDGSVEASIQAGADEVTAPNIDIKSVYSFSNISCGCLLSG